MIPSQEHLEHELGVVAAVSLDLAELPLKELQVVLSYFQVFIVSSSAHVFIVLLQNYYLV